MSCFVMYKSQLKQYTLLAKLKSFRQAMGVNGSLKKITTSALSTNVAATETLPIPNNMDIAESTRFSPLRSRDITTVFMSHQNGFGGLPNIDITTDNTSSPHVSGASSNENAYVETYDSNGTVSLCAAMQSNVPLPFGGHKFSHLNMPGGQWSQQEKFTSLNLQNSHYTALRTSVRSGWSGYNSNIGPLINQNGE